HSPLYLFALVGLPFVALGGLIGSYLLANHILNLIDATMGFQVTNRPLLIITVFLLLTGLLIFLIGLLAELVLRSASLGRGYAGRGGMGGKGGQAQRAGRSSDRRAARSPKPAAGAEPPGIEHRGRRPPHYTLVVGTASGTGSPSSLGNLEVDHDRPYHPI